MITACSRHSLLAVAGIVVLGFALRVGVLVRSTPFQPGGDESEYVGLATVLVATGEFRTSAAIQDIFQGGKPGDLTAYRSPVLPALIAVHYRVFGPIDLYPRLTLALVGALTCGVLACAGFRLAGSISGCAAALIWAVWPPAVLGPYASDRYYPETLGVFFLAAGTTCLIRAAPSLGTRQAVLAGTMIGFAVLTRGYLLPLPFLTAICLWMLRQHRPRAVLLFLLVSLIPPGVWIARNQVAIGRPVLSTQTDHFYLGNNRWARGSFNGDLFYLGRQSPQLVAMSRRFPGFWEMSETERSDAWTTAAKESVVGDPARFAWLLYRKTAVFWLPLQHWSVGWYTRHYAYMLIAALIPLGASRLLRAGRGPQVCPIAIAVGTVFVAALATYGFDRYRYVIEPLLVLVATAALSKPSRQAVSPPAEG